VQLGLLHFYATSAYALDGAVIAGMMPIRKFAERRSEGGQAMVEFALLIVFIFVLFVSMLQFILLMYAYTTLADAAKEGVRYAVVHGTGSGGSLCSGPSPGCGDSSGNNVKLGLASENWIGVLPLTQLSFQAVSAGSVTIVYADDCSTPGCRVRVSVSHQYSPLFGLGWPSITLNAAAEGRIMN